MSIFGGLNQQNPAESTIDPKRLFRALSKPSRSKFQFPYDIQTEVWDQWFSRRDSKDLILKMNTGSGKTVVGLLILKSSLNERKSPAVYLTPNLQLKSQVEETASELGIEWTNDVRDPEFRSGRAVLIQTMATMYNGKSKFGTREKPALKVDVGTIVIDDAHASISIVEEKFSLRIPKANSAYPKLLSLFADAFKGQSLAEFTEISAGRGSGVIPVPYWDWQDSQESVHRIIGDSTKAEKEKLQFVWPMIKDQLAVCRAAISSQEIEIALPYADLTVVPSFIEAQRRIYMTATLADDSILMTQMGVDEDCITKPITPSSASDLGDRIILTPLETSRVSPRTEAVEMLQRFATNHNVVVIVPSTYRAQKFWSEYTNEIHDKNSISNVVERLRNGHVGLVVLIARYDGIDLPDDACRILVLDGLPEQNSPLEQVELVSTREISELNGKQIQRIEQGMGRGVRSADDYCAVVLLDPRLVERLYSTASRKQFSPATRAQYELSEQFSSSGRNKTISEFFEVAIQAFLDRDPAWVSASKEKLEGVTYEIAVAPSVVATARRKAFDLAITGKPAAAAAAMSAAISAEDSPWLRAWYKQEAAAYRNFENPVQARELQRKARLESSLILKLKTMSFTKAARAENQAVASGRFIRDNFISGKELEIAVESMLRDLIPDQTHGSHRRFEAAFEKLGRLLGFVSSRPDQEGNVGPDNLWDIGEDSFWAVEAKSESTANQVSSNYLRQLSGHCDWFESEYTDPRYSYTAVLIHASSQPMWDAVPRRETRVMTFDRLEKFRGGIRNFVQALTAAEEFGDPETIRPNLQHFQLTGAQLRECWTVPFDDPAKRP